MIRTIALVAVILTAACSPDAGMGPTDRNSIGTSTPTSTSDKRTADDSTHACSAATDSKRSCDDNRWNGTQGKR